MVAPPAQVGHNVRVDLKAHNKQLEKQIAERDALIATLQDKAAELQAKLEKALDLIAKLQKNSSNSSKPPSSDIVSGKPKKAPKKRKKRKRGAQKGHKACAREPFEHDRVDEVVTHTADMDPDLWELLPGDYGCFQQVELVESPLYVTEHRLLRFRHRVTGRIFTTPRPDGLKGQGLFGPRMLALTSCLKSGLHGSYSAIQTLYRDAFGLTVSQGYLVKATDQMTKALAAPYASLLQMIRAQPVVNIDETGHKENGKRLMTWVGTCPDATVFRIADTRSTAELYALLGEDFDGVVGSDFFSAYLKYGRENDGVRAQYCWAHLIRELLYLAGLADKSTRVWAKKVLVPVKKLFKAWRRGQYAACRAAQRQIENLCRRLPKRGEVQTLGGRMWKHRKDYFRFLEDPELGIEPTNNSSERALRPLVMHRRVTQGTRSEKGRRWWEHVWSVVMTCRKHGRSVFDYLVEVLRAHALGMDPPMPAP